MATKTKHLHGEAFNDMVYTCETCGRSVNIWNSRDGVTPFSMGCLFKGCAGDMIHGNWKLDRYAPLTQLKAGLMLWGDFTCTEDEALVLADRRIEKVKEQYPDLKVGNQEEYESRRQELKQYFLDLSKNGAPELYVVNTNGTKIKAHL